MPAMAAGRKRGRVSDRARSRPDDHLPSAVPVDGRDHTPVVKLTGAQNIRISLAALICAKPGRRPRLIYRTHFSVLTCEGRDHLPSALEDPLMQFGLDDRPHNGFLAFGVGSVGHLAGPHPGGRAAQMRVGGAAPEHGDYLDRLDASAMPGGGVSLLRPGQFPVGVGAAVAIFARMVVDGAAAAQEGRVCLVEDPPHHRVKQAHSTAEYLHAFRPLAGALVGPGAKIAQMAEDVRRPGRKILCHASIMPPDAAKSRQAEPDDRKLRAGLVRPGGPHGG